MNNPMTLDYKSMARCKKPRNFENVTRYILNLFSDSDETTISDKILWEF